jgi:phosphotransferase system HPr (HPr) family protein
MKHSAVSPSDGPQKRKVKLTNSQGLHMRPAQAFVALANTFNCVVRVWCEGKDVVDGKSVLSLVLLIAEKGTELTVETEGPDAAAALDALIDLLANLENRLEAESPPKDSHGAADAAHGANASAKGL